MPGRKAQPGLKSTNTLKIHTQRCKQIKKEKLKARGGAETIDHKLDRQIRAVSKREKVKAKVAARRAAAKALGTGRMQVDG